MKPNFIGTVKPSFMISLGNSEFEHQVRKMLNDRRILNVRLLTQD